jgi:hypothetical protein
MDDLMIAEHLENLDRQFARVEQILPTLATREELRATEGKLRLAIADAVAPLATKEELQATEGKLRLAIVEAIAPLATKEELQATEGKLRLAIAEAIAPLATKEELGLAIADAVAPLATKDEIRELRRHMDVLSESQRGDIQLLAEHLAVVMSKLNDQ